MKKLQIEAYLQTPEIDFDPESGELKITGKSYPADALEFYQPIIEWCAEYAKNPANETKLICEIEYLNSASQKQLVELLMAFKPLQEQGKSFVVKWKYEEGDDDILSVGELVQHELGLPFDYEEVTF